VHLNVDSVEERLLRELAQAGPLRTDELARRLSARHWTDLCTPLTVLVSRGYATVVGPLGRPETRYRIHPRGRAALLADA
jgi:predicted ArsR family transcriptional regulator